MKFKLLQGMHIQNDSTGKEVIYHPNQVIESGETDLAARLGADRFEHVHDESFYTPPPGFKLVPIDHTSIPPQAVAGPILSPEAITNQPNTHQNQHGVTGHTSSQETASHGVVAKPLQTQKEVFTSLDKMSHKDLIKVAQEEEIDVTDCKTRDDCLKRVKAGLSQ